MVAEELSQEEIDSLFGGDEESSGVNPQVNKVFELLNAAVEEVFKTAFSLEVVSKFTGLTTAGRDEISLDGKIAVEISISGEDKSSTMFIVIDKRFASILSDLMLMGPGEAKDELEPDDLDALKELFSQVFGQLNTTVKDEISTPISFEVKGVTQETVELPESLYKASYDVALPNIEDGVLDVVVDKNMADSIFEESRSEGVEEEPETEEVPFKDVEEENAPLETQKKAAISKEAKNLDLIMDIDLEVKIRIGEKYMLIKDILDLKDGSIIELDKSIEEPMDILVNGKVVAQGVVVVVGGKFGVKITHIETREERIKSLGG